MPPIAIASSVAAPAFFADSRPNGTTCLVTHYAAGSKRVFQVRKLYGLLDRESSIDSLYRTVTDLPAATRCFFGPLNYASGVSAVAHIKDVALANPGLWDVYA